MPHSELASPSATRDILASSGLTLKKRLGQHFLVDDGVVGRTLALADLGPDDVVLEVGPGIGTLTVALCRAASAVVAVERDAALLPALERTTADCGRIAIVQADAVRVAVDELARPFGPPTALVANLPYEVAATVVLRCFQEIPSIEQATVMVQAEVADRMSAQPGGKDYGAYTVKLALQASVSGRFAVSRNVFMPPPRVDSAVVRLDRLCQTESAEDIAAASEAARAAFAQRRKTARNSIASALGADRDAVERALVSAGVDPADRAERIGVVEYVEIGQNLRKYGILP